MAELFIKARCSNSYSNSNSHNTLNYFLTRIHSKHDAIDKSVNFKRNKTLRISLSAETQRKPKNTQFDSIETTVVSVTRDLYLEVFNGRFSLSYLSLFYLIWRSKSAEAYNQSLFKHLFTQLLRLTFVCMFLYLTSHCYQLFLLDYSFPSSKNLRPLQLSDEESFLLSICNHNYITWF